MENRIASTDMRQECVAKSLSFGSPFHQTSNVDDIQISRYFAANLIFQILLIFDLFISWPRGGHLTWPVYDIRRDNRTGHLELVRDVLGGRKIRKNDGQNIFHLNQVIGRAIEGGSVKKKYLFSFGSMVQKGKFSAGAALFVSTLKKVDLPTFGTPTMPTRKLVPTRPINGFFSGSSTFFGAIWEIGE